MKVYSKVVIDMTTLETIEEESYEYEGPVAECKGGGAGGGSSPSTSGGQNYPEYMTRIHKMWLLGGGSDAPFYSVSKAMHDAQKGKSPYADYKVLNVDALFLGGSTRIDAYNSPYKVVDDFLYFDIDGRYEDFLYASTSEINSLLDAESNMMDDEIISKILPKFQVGLDNINAVQTSTFLLGESLIWDAKIKGLAKISGQMRLEEKYKAADIAIKRIGSYLEWGRISMSMTTELARIYSATRHDHDTLAYEISAKDKLFDLTIYQYGVNVMSSISGSAVAAPDTMLTTGSKSGGALSAALAGASMGASIPGAGGYGAVGGAAVGLAAYYFS